MKAHEALKLLDNLPDSTLRKYAQDYAQYLSQAPASRRHRDYTDLDVRILRLVMDMKAQRVKPADIDVTLSSLQAGNWERLPELDSSALSLVPTESAIVALQADKSAMQREIDILREMLSNATSDRNDLLERLYKAETLLELYESGRLQPPKQPKH